jgi:hypothetical protein
MNDPEYKRKWYLANREKLLARAAERYRRKQGELREYGRRWSRTDRGKASRRKAAALARTRER